VFTVSGAMRFSAREYKPKGHLGSITWVGSGIEKGGRYGMGRHEVALSVVRLFGKVTSRCPSFVLNIAVRCFDLAGFGCSPVGLSAPSRFVPTTGYVPRVTGSTPVTGSRFRFWSLCLPDLLEKRRLLAQNNGMDQRFVIEKLRHHEPELKAAGILHIRVFGSVARNEATTVSDVDLLADFDKSKRMTLVKVGSLQSRLSAMLGARVDLSSTEWMREPVKSKALREAVIAF
jgi:uncharacterized protein